MDKKILNTRNVLIGLAVGITGYLLFFQKGDAGAATDPTDNGGGDDGSGTAAFSAKRVAEGLYEAMRESGTNETRIKQLLTRVTQAQFGEVVKAFGKRSYNKTLGNQYNFNPFSDLPLEPLQVWLQTELSDEDYELLRSKYPTYL